MPIPADYRGFDPKKDKLNKGRFENPWFKTLADLYGKSRDEIEQREKRRQIHRHYRTLALGGLVSSLVFGSVWLWQNGYTVDQAALKIQSLVVSIHLEPEMQQMNAGTFQQGDTEGSGDKNEKPPHTVKIKAFAIGKFEVTFEEYDRFAFATGQPLPGDRGWGRGRRPVINVSWEEAKAYAGWLSKETGNRYRLPTESEWEYAARSGVKQERWAGTSDESKLDTYAVFGKNAEHRTAEVGTKQANGLGLHDMSGNVQEWVEDCWHRDYTGAPADNSAWLEANGGSCGLRVIRSGSWFSWSNDLRASGRLKSGFFAVDRTSQLGFRLAQDIP